MVRGFIQKDRKILLVKERKERSWETPGGSARYDETLQGALRREILEETGYSAKIGELFLTHIGGSKLVEGVKVLCLIYKVKLLKRIKKPSPDVVGVRYFSKDEIREMLKVSVDWHDKVLFEKWVRK